MLFPTLSQIPPWQRTTISVSLLCSILCITIAWTLPEKTSLFLYLLAKHDTSVSLLVVSATLISIFCVDKYGKMQSFFHIIATHSNWIASIAFAICSLGAWFLYHRHPLSMDEYSALLQSEIFSAGHIVGKIPPKLANVFLPVQFHDWFIYISRDTGAIAALYWPSLPLVMAPFSFFGVPWLCNPAITFLTFLVLARLLEELVTMPAARGFAIFSALASPVILINGMSYYGMPLQLLCSLVFTLGMIKGTTRWLLVAGTFAALGLATVNPVPFFLYAFPWLILGFTQMSQPWRKFGLLALIGLPLALLLGLGWKVFLIENFHHAQQRTLSSDISSMVNIFEIPSIRTLIIRELGLIKLYLWAVPGLPVLAYFAGCHPAKERWARLMAASALSLLIGYLFVPFDQGHGWGYRYFHVAWFVLPVLAAIMLQKISEENDLRQRAYGFAFSVSIGSLLFLVPLRFYQTESLIRAQMKQIPMRIEGNGRQAVFVKIDCGFQSIDLVQNDPFLRSNEIHLVSNGYKEDAKIAAMLGTRPRLVSNASCGDRWLLD